MNNDEIENKYCRNRITKDSFADALNEARADTAKEIFKELDERLEVASEVKDYETFVILKKDYVALKKKMGIE